MTGIKDLFRVFGVFRRVQWQVLQSGLCRFYTQNPQRIVSNPPKNPNQNVSASTALFKPFGFRIICLSGLIIFWAFMGPNPAFSANEKSIAEEDEILEMDIRQLMQTEVTVTSVSKRPELVHKTASAVYVLTGEDIRRSGAVNIMEALRMVPGVLVSKLNQNRYAISIRGFNQRLGSDKLLVLMDGRTIYSPTDAGVFWIGQDTVLEDIDRIEVIRGPGAALWGSNAVAGGDQYHYQKCKGYPGWIGCGRGGHRRTRVCHAALRWRIGKWPQLPGLWQIQRPGSGCRLQWKRFVR